MSLEAKLEELNENIVKLIDVMSLASAVAASPAKGADAEEPKGKKGPGRPPKDESKKADKAADDKKKVPTEDDIRRVFGDFMRVDDEDEREKRKTYVKGVLKEYGVAKATDLKPEDRAAAISVIEDEKAKRDAKAGDDEDDDLV